MGYGNTLDAAVANARDGGEGDLAQLAERIERATSRAFDAAQMLRRIADRAFGPVAPPPGSAGKDAVAVKPPAMYMVHGSVEQLHEVLTELEGQAERFSRL